MRRLWQGDAAPAYLCRVILAPSRHFLQVEPWGMTDPWTAGLTPQRRSYTSAVFQPASVFGHSGRFVARRRASYEGVAMSRRCELTGKTAQVGHKVSHSNIKTKRRFLPNLLNVTLMSDALGRSVRLRVSAHAFKTVDHRGGLDAFLLKASDDDLSPNALSLKREIRAASAA